MWTSVGPAIADAHCTPPHGSVSKSVQLATRRGTSSVLSTKYQTISHEFVVTDCELLDHRIKRKIKVAETCLQETVQLLMGPSCGPWSPAFQISLSALDGVMPDVATQGSHSVVASCFPRPPFLCFGLPKYCPRTLSWDLQGSRLFLSAVKTNWSAIKRALLVPAQP